MNNDILYGVSPQNMTQQAALELLAKLPGDIEVTLKQAEQMTMRLPDFPENCRDLSQHRIVRLGARRKNEETIEPLAALAAGGRPFSISLRGQEDGSTYYLIGGQQVRGGLRLARGVTETEDWKEGKTRSGFESWCVCGGILKDLEGLERPDNREESPLNWLDALAQAAAGSSYGLSFFFSPVEPKWLEEQIQAVSAMQDTLSHLTKSGLQVSLNDGASVNDVDEIRRKAVVFFKGERRLNLNSGITVSQEMSQEHNLIAACYDALRFRLKELIQLRRDGGFSVSVRAFAADRDILALAESVVVGVLAQEGLACRWTSREPQTAFLLPSCRLNRLASCPEHSFPGFSLVTPHSYETNPPTVDGKCVQIGSLVWNECKTGTTVSIPLKELNRHAFICGMTGSGKSNTVCSLLTRLDPEIPFLVIEPVKGEYRSLQDAIPGRTVEVCTMDTGGDELLAFNPFWFPKNGKLQYHIDSLKSIISAAFDLYAAMPNILEQCLTAAYIKKGWKLAISKNAFEGKLPDELLYPTFSNLCQEVEHYLDSSDFADELRSNYKGALLTRLQSFTGGVKGLLLNCSSPPRFQEWAKERTSCILELDALADDSDKAIVMGALLSQYFQCVKCSDAGTAPGLKHMIVIEEAHHLFRDSAVGSSSEGGPGSRQQLVETLNNLLAEIRAYGEGVLIVDQSPTGVSSQVIKNTAVKIVHRTDYGDDLEVLRQALLLDQEDEDGPASLEAGFALVRYGSMKGPAHTYVPLCKVKEEKGIQKKPESAVVDFDSIQAMFQLSSVYKEKLCSCCGKFVNQLLFDSRNGAAAAYQVLVSLIRVGLRDLGYQDATVTAELNPENLLYTINNAVDIYLYNNFPNQQLLCGQLRMLVDRYLALEAYRKTGIREQEWTLLRRYCETEIYPTLVDILERSNDKLTYWFTQCAPGRNRAWNAGVLRQFVTDWICLEKEYGKDMLNSTPLDSMNCALSKSQFLVPLDTTVFSGLWNVLQFYFYALETDESNTADKDE